MNKIIIFFILLMMMFCVTACDNTETSSTSLKDRTLIDTIDDAVQEPSIDDEYAIFYGDFISESGNILQITQNDKGIFNINYSGDGIVCMALEYGNLLTNGSNIVSTYTSNDM